MNSERALTAVQVAELLGVHRNTVRKWTATGRLPVWFRTDSGRPVYSERTIIAHQQRAGELEAERQAS